jgi:hypothetical protein
LCTKLNLTRGDLEPGGRESNDGLVFFDDQTIGQGGQAGPWKLLNRHAHAESLGTDGLSDGQQAR